MLLTFAALALVVVIIWRMVNRYRATKGTTWERVKATTEQSLTLLLGYCTIVGGNAINIAGTIADSFDLPSAKDWIAANMPSQYVGAGLIALGALIVLARLRGIWSVVTAARSE